MIWRGRGQGGAGWRGFDGPHTHTHTHTYTLGTHTQAKIAGSIALYTVLQGAVTRAAGGGTYKYVFAGVAVVGLSVATLCGGVAAYLHLKGA